MNYSVMFVLMSLNFILYPMHRNSTALRPNYFDIRVDQHHHSSSRHHDVYSEHYLGLILSLIKQQETPALKKHHARQHIEDIIIDASEETVGVRVFCLFVKHRLLDRIPHLKHDHLVEEERVHYQVLYEECESLAHKYYQDDLVSDLHTLVKQCTWLAR